MPLFEARVRTDYSLGLTVMKTAAVVRLDLVATCWSL